MVPLQPKKAFSWQKNADIKKIKKALALKGISSETAYAFTYLPNFKSPLPPQSQPLKNPPRLGLNMIFM